jgi:hypothetical protein
MATPSQTNVALLTQDPAANTDSAILNLAGGGATSQRPANPPLWFHYYDLDLGRDVIWNGTDWVVTVAGPQGLQGAQGPQGAQGFQGFQGFQGVPGSGGVQGPQGAQGPAGIQGPPGVQGPQGPQGSALPMNSGPTANRPSNPSNFDRYFDTDINCQIWWERGAWRTVAGTPGDVKFVTAASESDALTQNPGWTIVSVNWMGRAPVFAGNGPTATGRNPGDSFGEEFVELNLNQTPNHIHVVGRFRSQAGATGDDGMFRYQGGGVTFGNGSGRGIYGDLGRPEYFNLESVAGDYIITNGREQQSGTPEGHNNVQPSIAIIGIVKQ